MQRLQRRVRLGGGALAALALAAAACGRPALVAPTVEGGPSPCGADGRGVALQVLGSGGPIADDRRASSGYLVWSEGEARALVDVGGGVFQRFAASGASLDDLEVIVLAHLHDDPTGDLPALVKSGVFGDRGRPLPLVGPDGSELFPALGAFLAALFGPQGAYPYLGGALAGEGLRLEPREVAVAGAGASFELPGLRLRVVGVPHGVVPALGARIDVGGVSIAFTGDQRMDDPRFAAMIAGVDLLVAHHAIPEESGARGPGAPRHALGDRRARGRRRRPPPRPLPTTCSARSARSTAGSPRSAGATAARSPSPTTSSASPCRFRLWIRPRPREVDMFFGTCAFVYVLCRWLGSRGARPRPGRACARAR
ncbi:MAG: MBL fold metallo-hydrolase [Myxococcales bacterium]|nr:MBL fold metallo-hydrolase [Myxococcales bacterium]